MDDLHRRFGHPNLGQNVYQQACATCHKGGLAGAPIVGDKEQWKARIAQGMDVLVEHAVKGYQGSLGYMPPKGGQIQLVLNTPLGRKSKHDERAIRLAAMEQGVPCVTTLPGAAAAVCGIEAVQAGAFGVRALQDVRPGIREAVAS